MPKFTLIKHGDNDFDSEVTMEFYTETLDLARAHYDDFLQAAGFELMPKGGATTLNIPDPEDWLWNDAFESKFGINLNGHDGPVGAEGADIIQFPTSDQ